MFNCEGNCECPECRPDQFPSGSRKSRGHIAIRYYYTTGRERHRSAKVWLNGANFTDACNEAIPGRHGAVTVFLRRFGETMPHRCRCGEGACQRVLRGRVRTRGDYKSRKVSSA